MLHSQSSQSGGRDVNRPSHAAVGTALFALCWGVMRQSGRKAVLAGPSASPTGKPGGKSNLHLSAYFNTFPEPINVQSVMSHLVSK